ncbi:UPF0481 protein [Salvia divinorum]|uniref:UPF0481 protein n=1 Tax=Salvia divinorum TaxID=28513 RepID=A0ABD1IJW5_SALDI
MAEIDDETPRSAVSASIQPLWRLHRVPAHVRQDKKYIYEPAMVPLGPYHQKEHPQLHLVEPLKNELLDMVCTDAVRKSFLLSKICERIHEIRHFYGGADDYDDKELSEMMLRDACFLKFVMDASQTNLIRQRLGMSGQSFMFGDTLMLENQIPLWLVSLIFPNYKSLMCHFLSDIVFGDDRMTQLPWENRWGVEPIHSLEALIHAYVVPHETHEISSTPKFLRFFNRCFQPKLEKKRPTTLWQKLNNSFRSATDLKAKGIHFRRSSNCLTDIQFFSFAFYAELRLPFFYISDVSKVFFSNAIAFEMSPEARDPTYGMTTYFTFMKTLIHNVNDVKVLREKGILYSLLTRDEEVVELFKSIDTYGLATTIYFTGVKARIEEHCNNKGRTWMADLINTKFQSPWTVMALAAAAFLLCLTFLQTYYTINPATN